MKQSFADILKDVSNSQARKVAAKLPDWAGIEGLEFPTSLCLEQCSSSAAAAYKAALAQRQCSGTIGSVTDLTCGLGVDTFAFSKVAGKVVSFEANAQLAEAVSRNMVKLGSANVEVRGEAVSSGTVLPESDLIFADPARRDSAGKKVFLLEDCTPNILELMGGLFEKAPHVMLKLSPMADISMCAARLGNRLREVHVVALKGEVKELLCLLDRDWNGGWTTTVVELESGESLTFKPEDEAGETATYVSGIEPGKVLYEPSGAVLKAGAFKLPCSLWGVRKLAPFTHLYEADAPVPLGRNYRIVETFPLSGSGMKEAGRKYPVAEVTARNVPMSSEQLRSRLGVKPGATDIHMFGCTVLESRVLIITKLL